jgi:hypothetical protein
VGLAEVLGPDTINFEVFSKFIDIQAILQFAVDGGFTGGPFQKIQLQLVVFTCLSILKAIISHAIPKGEGIIVEFMEGGGIFLFLFLSELKFSWKGLLSVQLFGFVSHGKLFDSINNNDYYLICIIIEGPLR